MKLNTSIGRERKGIWTTIKKDYGAWLLGLPALLCIIITVWNPIAQGIVRSFFRLQGYTPVEFVGLDNYRLVVGDAFFLSAVKNTFLYIFWSLILTYLPPVFLAFAINELRYFKGAFKFITYLPGMVSAIATAVIWTMLFRPGENGVANAILAHFHISPQSWFEDTRLTIPMIIVASSWQGLGGAVLMYFSSLQTVNAELYESAIMDGAGVLRRIWNITIPQVRNMILLMFVQQIISVSQMMIQPLTMTDGGPMNRSLTLCLQSYYYAFRDMNIDRSLALGVITAILLAVITSFYHIMDKKFGE